VNISNDKNFENAYIDNDYLPKASEFEQAEEASAEDISTENILEDIEQPEEKPKKFVFRIAPENIEFIQNLSQDERSSLINQLIDDHIHRRYVEYEEKKAADRIKTIILTIIIIILGTPFILQLLNFSLVATKSNYGIMQNNFETLYRSKGRY